MNLKISEILKVTGERTLLPGCKNATLDTNVAGISTDSRKLKKGELFIALKGERFDGNDFISDAFKKGAIGVIVSKFNPQSPLISPEESERFPGLKSLKSQAISKGTKSEYRDKSAIRNPQFIIQVPDTLKILGDIAKYYRGKFRIPLIAITGSCGKTTTKEITSSILSSKFKVLKSLHNYNNLVGLPLTLFKLTPEEEVAVLEMGMSQPGEIKRLSQIAQPTIAVITNVGKAHIGFFNSLKDIAKAKAELFQVSVKPKISILNRDDEFFSYFVSRTKGETITFGTNTESDFCAERITFDSLGKASFYLNGERKIKLPFLGRGNIYNVLASFAIASSMGMKTEDMIPSLSRIELLPGRTNLYETDGIYVLDDTYNANPSSLINLLETIEKIKVKGKKILVFGDMLELGENVEKEHIEAGRLISNSSIDILITVGHKTEFTAKSTTGNRKVWYFSDQDNAKKKLESLLDKGDLLVIKGSRAMGMEKFLPEEVGVGS